MNTNTGIFVSGDVCAQGSGAEWAGVGEGLFRSDRGLGEETRIKTKP